MRSRHTIALASLIALCAITSCSNTHQDNAVEPLDPANYPTTPDTTTTTTTPGSQTTTTSTASSSTTPPTDTAAVTSLSGQPGIEVPDSVKQELIQAYQKSVAASYAASSIPDPAFPALAENFTGAALEKMVTEIAKLQQTGRKAELPSESKSTERLELVRVYGQNHAEIETCSIDDGIVKETNTGMIVNNNVGVYREHVILEYTNGTWKRSGSLILGKNEASKCVF